MLLCDIGNTTYTFFDGKRLTKHPVSAFDPSSIQEKVYFISVNQAVTKQLHSLKNWIDLERFVERKNYYETMGIDRIAACEAIRHGVVVDAGSAVTVDVVKDGVFEGGFIYPGIQAIQTCWKTISPALAYPFKEDLHLKELPKRSDAALSYGYVAPLVKEVASYDLPVFLTGGDAQTFALFFPDAKHYPHLLFDGMQKILSKKGLLS